MNDPVSIERLAMRVPDVEPGAAATLARLVAQGLAPGMFQQAGNSVLDLLRVEVRPTEAEQRDPEQLARRIVAEIEQALGATR